MSNGGRDAWSEYEAWNEAILETLFPELDEPEPVYMDFEDDVLEALGQIMGVNAGDTETRLCSCVKATMGSGGPADIFASHVRRTVRWQRLGRRGAPPFLALLAVFCLAAEQMSRGEGMSQSNYFGRLRPMLGRGPSDHHVEAAYRRVSEGLWASLNTWLAELDGTRGIPTAYSLSHRYVGLTLSQALVRKSDRERFNTFFRHYGFAPGSEIPPSELEVVLSSWFAEEPSPVSMTLQRLWRKGEARKRISQVAAVALAAWDGSIDGQDSQGGAPRSGQLSLALEIGGFPRKRFALQALLYLPQASTPRDGVVLTASPQATVELVPDIRGALGLGRMAALNASDVLEGILRIEDTLTGAVVERRPRRLVLFRQDDLSRRWIEAPQVLLGDNVTLVAHIGLVPRLESVLAVVARSGWEIQRDTYGGQPTEWVVVRGVEVLAPPGDLIRSGMDDLSALVPLTSSQLKVAGGFALPGHMKGKWHTRQAPEITAVSDVEGGFEVRLVDLMRYADELVESTNECVLEIWSDGDSGVIVEPLQDLELVDCDYRVEMSARATGEVLTSTTVRLRSADTPDVRQWSTISSVAYHPLEGLGVLGVAGGEAGPTVRGLTVQAQGTGAWSAGDQTLPEAQWWEGSTRASGSRTIPDLRLTMPDPDSCIHTGMHYEMLETVPVTAQGRPLVAWTQGRCKGCGLVRRYRTSLRSSRNLPSARPAARLEVRDLSRIREVHHGGNFSDLFEIAFDAVLHVGGGNWSSLERIALQLEPTSLFVDQFARSLETLGHIDVRRDHVTLEPQAWEVAPTSLAGMEAGWLFSGYWPGSLWHRVGSAIEEAGGELVRAEQEGGPASYYAVAPGDLLPLTVGEVDADVAVIGSAWESLAASLPPLSELIAALPRSDASTSGSLKWFDVRNARWVGATGMGAVGAYRVTRFSTMDVIRTSEDLEHGTMARSSVQLSKHVAALLHGLEPLLAYDPDASELLVPLGADLPGLYGRCVVASSGLLPVADTRNRLLRYQEVPSQLAAHIYSLLSARTS